MADIIPKQCSIEAFAEPQNLKVIRAFFEEAAKCYMDRKDIIHMKVCLNEICENIIRHGYEKGRRETIKIKLQFDKSSARVTVIDRGKPFNLLEYKPMDTDTLMKKGIKGKLGISTIRRVCNKISYKWLKGSNRVVLIKKIGKRPSTVPAI